MKNPKKNAISHGMHAVTPHLVCAGATDAIEFYREAFGAEELLRLPGPDGKLMHACISINGAQVFLVDENIEYGTLGPKALKGSPVFIHLVVKDVDSFVTRAADAGAKITMPVTDMFWGDRYGQLEDPFGHRWSVATHIKDMTPDEVKQAMQQSMSKPAEKPEPTQKPEPSKKLESTKKKGA